MSRVGPRRQYLYFLSEREFAPQISDVEWNFAGNRRTGSSPWPCEGRADPSRRKRRVGADKKDEKKDKKDEKKDEPKKAVEPCASIGRALISAWPACPSGGQSEQPGSGEGNWSTPSGAFFYGRDSYAKPGLWLFDLKKRKESELAADIQGFALSQDGSKAWSASSPDSSR